jgi:flagellar M-ring protein FliF
LHEIIAPGTVNRMSVSVMVDGITDETQLASIRSAVEVAAGVDSTRGDQIVVESFAFDRTAMDELNAELAAQEQRELYMQIGMAVAAALVVLALLFFSLRMINNVRNASKENWKTIMRPVGEMAALQQTGYAAPALNMQSELSSALSRMSDQTEHAAAVKTGNEDVVVQLQARTRRETASEDDQNARVISRLTEENPATVAEIIQVWLNEGKKS